MANINDYVIGILHRRVQGINKHILNTETRVRGPITYKK